MAGTQWGLHPDWAWQQQRRQQGPPGWLAWAPLAAVLRRSLLQRRLVLAAPAARAAQVPLLTLGPPPAWGLLPQPERQLRSWPLLRPGRQPPAWLLLLPFAGPAPQPPASGETERRHGAAAYGAAAAASAAGVPAAAPQDAGPPAAAAAAPLQSGKRGVRRSEAYWRWQAAGSKAAGRTISRSLHTCCGRGFSCSCCGLLGIWARLLRGERGKSRQACQAARTATVRLAAL